MLVGHGSLQFLGADNVVEACTGRAELSLFFGDSDYLGGNAVEREGLEVRELLFVDLWFLADVVLQDLLFLRIVLEVGFQGFVADNLLLELNQLLIKHSFLRKLLNNLIDTRLHSLNLMPNHGQESKHIGPAVELYHLFLNLLQILLLLLPLGRLETDDSAILTLNLLGCLTVLLVALRHVEVDDPAHLLYLRQGLTEMVLVQCDEYIVLSYGEVVHH